MTNFKVGMKVVCVEPSPFLKKGKIFTVLSVSESPCCSCTTIDVGVRVDPDYMFECSVCGRLYPLDNHFRATRFRPLQYDSNVNFEVMAKFQPTEERQDVKPVRKTEKV